MLPHAVRSIVGTTSNGVSQIAGTSSAPVSFAYDANGNMASSSATGGGTTIYGRAARYTSLNVPN